jgi:hypothetical protein
VYKSIQYTCGSSFSDANTFCQTHSSCNTKPLSISNTNANIYTNFNTISNIISYTNPNTTFKINYALYNTIS